MNAFGKLKTGVQNPDVVVEKLLRLQRKGKALIPHDVGVQGSYWTGNIGDRAIAEAIQTECESRGYSTKFWDKKCTYSNSSVKILGGGGVIHDWYGVEHLKRRMKYISNGGSLLAVGVPGCRSQESKELVANTLENANVVTVRDSRSKDELEKIGINAQITACPAFLHEKPDIEETYATGVNFRPWFSKDKVQLDADDLSYYFDYPGDLNIDELRLRYIDNIKIICDSFSNPVFIPFHKKDEEFAREYLDINILDYEFSVKKTLERVARVEKMVAMRYHSLIFAAICETPVVALAYEPKVELLADRLEVSSAKPHEFLELDFTDPSNISDLEELAMANFDILFDCS